MKFLDLCREAARDSGTLAGGAGEIVTTLNNRVGRIDKIVCWVRDAYVNIQLEHRDWRWMRREFQAPLVALDPRYSGADLDQGNRVAEWIGIDDGEYAFTLQDPDLTRADEAAIRQIDYATFRARYGRGVHDASRPIEFAVDNTGRLCFGPTPDKAYIVRGLYRTTPQVLEQPADVPEMPEHFHKIIVWEAIKLMSIADEATIGLQTSVGEYARLRDALGDEQRPRASISFDSSAVIA